MKDSSAYQHSRVYDETTAVIVAHTNSLMMNRGQKSAGGAYGHHLSSRNADN